MKYDDSLRTPAPAIDVVLRSPRRSAQAISMRAILDTGAGITVIPLALVAELQLQVEERIVLVGYDNAITESETCLVNLEMVGYTFRAVSVVAAPRATVLLGRDILNRFRITLDGKAQTFEMIDP